MLFAFGPADLQRYAIPIGIGLAVLMILIVPTLRRSVKDSFKKGHERGERFRGTKRPEGDNDGAGGK